MSGKEWIGDAFKTRMGLPQGQELSPILFALFIADFCPNTNGEDDVGILDCMGNLILIRAIFFADDLVLIASSRDKLCELCDNFKIYCDANKLTINYKKTKEMIFCKGKVSKVDAEEIKIGEQRIEKVTEFKHLGMWLTPQLRFTNHIKKMVKKARGKVGYIFEKLNISFLPMKVALQVFN